MKIRAKIAIIVVENREPYYFIIICKCNAAFTHPCKWRGEQHVYQSHIHLVICCVIRLAIRGARSRSGFSNTGTNSSFALCVRTCECLCACENSSFAYRQRHTNVRACGEARHKHERVNAV